MNKWTTQQIRALSKNLRNPMLKFGDVHLAAEILHAHAALLDQQASAKTQPAVSDAPISIEAVTAACDAYTESAVEHGWERETIEDILRNDDMRAAIAAAIAVIKEPQA